MAEKQKVLRICENRRVRIAKLNKLGKYLRIKDEFSAWYLIREYLQRIKGISGLNILVIDERFAMPVGPYKPTTLTDTDIKELTDQNKVADEACNLTRAQTDLNQHKSHYYDLLGLAACGAVFCVIIIAMLAISGKVDIGRFFGGG